MFHPRRRSPRDCEEFPVKPHSPNPHSENRPSRPGPLHRPAEVARILRCSEWWVKEQARKGRIPFSWIGGSYRFTDEHITEIVRLCERRPASVTPSRRETPAPPPSQSGRPESGAPARQLKARRPRRAQSATDRPSIAA
ncbi:helix-turn-helix domain-containing protein [Micromonospora sp. NBC_01813]|uniref:helix-turn-helix domain-containing protein n=1 Tax=Micromonospora sp. NBC_01813 TaxID=2975988 RepID=UPI002DDADC21|nr:helix-turn-helix domain-containing protein [Micromonospora sp. NBC_01813]WSA06789.1 helix-turn-helix domain-containing protein [Micromonospora sp. NBC_01813]